MGSVLIFIIICLGIIAVAIVSIDKSIRERRKRKAGEVKLRYLGGHPQLPKPLEVWLTDSGTYISFWNINIAKSGITEIKLVPQSGSGAALAGATVGMLVAGPVGALAGGAAASNKPGVNYLLQMSYMESGIRYEILFNDPDILNKYPLVQKMAQSGITREVSLDV